MSILDLRKTARHISNWIYDYVNNAGVNTLVLGLSGGIDSALVALLCKQTRNPLVCVNMPCRSSNSAFERAAMFAKDYDINLLKVDLTKAHELISMQVSEQVNQFNSLSVLELFKLNNNGVTGGLSSCLRAPTLSFLAHATNGLIVGTGNRSEDNLVRFYQKFGDGCVDISPISDLFKSEVRELFKFLAEDQNNGVMSLGAQAIYDAVPSADLFGPDGGHEDEKELGMTYDEIEWADRLNVNTGIIFNDLDPTKHDAWVGLTAQQQKVIAKVWHMEKISRHKVNSNLPMCNVRNMEGLVK